MSYRGRLLLAQPDMLDPNFHQTVIFIIEHNDEGALGVVLNRPLDLRADEHAAEWSDQLAEPAMIFSGGPVGQGSALALGESMNGTESDGFTPIIDRIGMVALDQEKTVSLEQDASAAFSRMRLFSGYAGWGNGQVEAELASDAWFVLDVHPDDPFTRNPSGLWSTVLKRQGGALSRLAHYPTDPGLN